MLSGLNVLGNCSSFLEVSFFWNRCCFLVGVVVEYSIRDFFCVGWFVYDFGDLM